MAALPQPIGLLLFAVTLLGLAGGGAVLARGGFREANPNFALSAGLFIGPAVWLALLNAFFYLVPSAVGVALASAAWLGLVGLTYWRARLRFVRPSPRTGALLALQTTILVGLALAALANRQHVGYPDETWTVPLAATMLRGNFPPVSPWAPDLAATYHYGASLAAVGLHVLSGLDFVLLFELLGAAAQAAVLVLIAHLLWRLPHGQWVALPVVVLLLGRGAKVFSQVPWLVNIVVPAGPPGPGLRASLREIYVPPGDPASGILAGGPPQIELLQYPVAIGLGLVVAHYAATGGGGRVAGLLLGVLLATAGLLETSTMLVFGTAVLVLGWTGSSSRTAARAWQVPTITLTVAAPLAIAAGGVISDTLFRSTALAVAAAGIEFAPASVWERVTPGDLETLTGGVGVLRVAAWPVLALALLAALLARNRLALALAAAGAAAWLGFRLLDYRFSDDIVRLDMFARVFGVLALAFAIASIRRRIPRPAAAGAALLVLGFVAWPSAASLLVPTAANLGRGIDLSAGLEIVDSPRQLTEVGLRRTRLTPSLVGAANIIEAAAGLPGATRVLSTDPSAFAAATGLLTPFTTLRALQYVPIAGPEYLDAIRTLAPAALRRMDVAYLHLAQGAPPSLPAAARSALDGSREFRLIAGRPQGPALYRVEDAARLADRSAPTHTYLALEAAIPPRARVYVSPALGGEARNRIFYALRDRDLYGALGEAGHARLQFQIAPLSAGVPLDYVALPATSAPLNFDLVHAVAVWAGDGVRVYRLPSEGVAPSQSSAARAVTLHPLAVEGLRLRFSLAYRAADRSAQFTGVEWLVYAADAPPYFEPRAGDVGDNVRQWFAGQIGSGTVAAAFIYEYDHERGTLTLLEGPNAPLAVARSRPSDLAGPWALALVFKSGRNVVGIVPIAAIDGHATNAPTIRPFRGTTAF